MTTVAPWLPLALLVVPTLAAVVVVLAGLFQLVFGRRPVVQVPRAVVVSAPALAPAPVRVARGTAPPAHRPASVMPVVAPRVQPVRSGFDEEEPTAFYVRQFAAR